MMIKMIFIYYNNRRKHYLCISAPAMTMPPEPDAPGPGQYDLVNYDGDIPQFAASSMFVSTTNRWNSKRNKTAPGPGMSFVCFILIQISLFFFQRKI